MFKIMPTAPRRIVIHGIDHARAACAAARELDVAVHLVSAPGAASYAGPAWFRELIAAIRAEYPDADIAATLDCGDAPGHALAALRAGVGTIRFTGPKRVRDKIAAIAAELGATLETGSARALDLAGAADAEHACLDWLSRQRPRQRAL